MVLTPEQWIEFAESGNQQRLRTTRGQHWQGWVMELNEDALLISIGSGERGEERWLPLADIAVDSLAFFDPQTQDWRPFLPG
jgi:hypothetical protein